jgi:predicted ATPase
MTKGALLRRGARGSFSDSHLEAVAALAESLLAAAPQLHLLATSREPLRAAGEFVRRLPPLAVPPEAFSPTAEQATGYSAIELFVERARAGSGTFTLADADVPDVCEICRRLDGNALAIELAAGRVDAFGIRGVVARLVDRFSLLKGGKRTALRRHQGLAATLDWSYSLLADGERAVLRRLSVFVGAFTLDAAGAVAGDGTTSASDVAYCVASLVSKSLVSVDAVGAHLRHRLLDTTSAYAREMLQAARETDEYSQRHARYFCDLLTKAAIELRNRDALAWVANYGHQLDNIRKALDWSFSGTGHAVLGVALTIAAVPLWLNLSLMGECQHRVRRAILHVGATDPQSALRQMQLHAALGVALYSIGTSAEAKSAWLEVLTRAKHLGNTDFRLRALWGLWSASVNGGEHRTGLALAREFAQIAEDASDTDALMLGDRMVGTSHHFLGEHATARRHIERMLDRCRDDHRGTGIARFQLDQTVASRAYLAKILWVQGCPDQAASLAERNLSAALQIEHSLSICYCLGQSGCSIAFFNGDMATAERYVALLLDHAAKCRLALWSTMGRGFKGILLVKRGDADHGLKLLRESTDALRASSLAHYHTSFLAELAQGLGAAGRVALGLEAIEAALGQSTLNSERWCLPELMRIQSELWLREAAPGASERAEDCLLRALELAQVQEAPAWELRTAISLARLRPADRARRYRELLQTIYDRFHEGFGTADLQSAERLLDLSA